MNAGVWQGDIFYARVARRTLGGEGEEGGWKRENHLFGAENSLPVYPADTGLLAFDMETHKLRRIASISGGDRPYALFGDLGLLVWRSEEHTSELPSLMPQSNAAFCLKIQHPCQTHIMSETWMPQFHPLQSHT